VNKSYSFLIVSIIVFVLFTLALFPHRVPPELPRERLLDFSRPSITIMEVYDAPTGKTILLANRDGHWYFGEKKLLDKYIDELLDYLYELDAFVSDQDSPVQAEPVRFRLTLRTKDGEALGLTVGPRVDRTFSSALVSQSPRVYLLEEYSLWRIRDLLNQALMVEPLFRSLLQ
jgi:hypothetical protein